MTDFIDQPKYFEQLEIGQCWRSSCRTVTETDVVQFACLTGDFNPLHMDHKYARSTPFGRPIAHGLLGLSLLMGMGSNSPSVVTAAFLRVADWKFLHPIYIGDTLRVETEVFDKQSRSKRHGMIIWRRKLINDESNIVVQQGLFETLVKTAELSRMAA